MRWKDLEASVRDRDRWLGPQRVLSLSWRLERAQDTICKSSPGARVCAEGNSMAI